MYKKYHWPLIFLYSWVLGLWSSFSYAVECQHDFSPLEESALLGLMATVEEESMVRGVFEQEKTLQVLKKPLLAQGDFLFSPQQGLLWHIQNPFEYSLIMTDDYFVQKTEMSQQVISAKEQPAIFSFGKVFSGILSADFSLLKEHFNLWGKESELNDDVWQVCLEPKQAPFKQLIAQIKIRGSRFVEQVDIIDHNNDFSRIVFSQVTITAQSLTDNEQALFDIQ